MRKNTTFMFAAAVAALLLVGCDKGASYSSFELSTADFRGADGAKTHWAAQGLYWNVGDVVVINGIEHAIAKKNDTCWYTVADEATSAKDGGYFYVAYPFGTMLGDGTVEDVNFSGGVVPLACKGKTNKLTLYPCCAVIKSSTYTQLTFPEGCDSSMILARGDIDVANNVLRGGEEEEFDYEHGVISATTFTDSVGNNYNYFVIPMADGFVRVKLLFDGYSETNGAVDIRAGYMYTVD